jgi:hypothetical protein
MLDGFTDAGVSPARIYDNERRDELDEQHFQTKSCGYAKTWITCGQAAISCRTLLEPWQRHGETVLERILHRTLV